MLLFCWYTFLIRHYNLEIFISPFTLTRYLTWLKKIQPVFCKPYGGVKTISNFFFHMLRSLTRISWGTSVTLGVKGCFFPFINNFPIEWQIKQSINWFLGMIFINSNRKLQLFDNYLTFKIQNTEYNYIYVENHI